MDCTRVTSIMLVPDWQTKPGHVYIGMPCRYTRSIGMTDVPPFGKPWECLDDQRGWQIAYREYAIRRVTTDPTFALAVLGLHGKTLVCFCKGGRRGADAACHGDMLAELVERLFHGING